MKKKRSWSARKHPRNKKGRFIRKARTKSKSKSKGKRKGKKGRK